MSVLEWRGGFPAIFRGTVATNGVVTPDVGDPHAAGEPIIPGKTLERVQEDGRKGPSHTKWVEIRNLDGTAGNGLLVYFTQQQFDDDDHALVIPGGASSLSVWSAPAEIFPARGGTLNGIWIRAQANTPAFCITSISRRG